MRAAVLILLALSCATMPVDPLFRDYSGDVPGASVVVIRDGRVVLRKSYGLADVEARVPVTPATNFRLASVSKQFTAAAIAILGKRGALSYDDPIVKYLTTLPAYARPITIRHLLTHTSGLPDYEDFIPAAATEQVHDADVLRLVEATDHADFPPGSRYRYSNTGYVFLGLIVEKVSGIPFAAFLKREIFEPLGMHGTAASPNVVHRAYGYTRENGAWVRRDQSITSATLGDGGIYSSIDDLVQWDKALETATLTPYVDTDTPGVRYGFGWRFSDHRGHRAVWHSGETVSFRNVIVRFPDDRLTVIILTNRDDPEPHQTALKIADLFLP